MSGIEINQFNLNSGILNKHRNVIFQNTHWHKIIVENVEGLDRETVLKNIMQFCYPLHFIPVSYQSSKNTATFLMKNCGGAIDRMCTQGLIIVNPCNKEKPFKIAIQLCAATSSDLKINIQDNAVTVLNKRFNYGTGILNLDSFAKDTELEEFCPLSQPKLLFYILHLARNIQFKFLKLSNNDIENLKPLEGLLGSKTLIGLDLRNNNIKAITELENLKDFNITELWLDGNPVCNLYDEFTYGRAVRERLEKIERLDGVNIQTRGFLPFRRNYLCSLTGYDLVDQFLEHYFTLYDATSRSVLDGLYHKEALLSITTNYLPLQSTSPTARLSVYNKVSRNLLQMSDFSKNVEFLFAGPYQILKILTSLPQTEHDPFSFTVDLVMCTENSAVLVVAGVFRETTQMLLETDRLLSFTKTFVLLAGQNGEYNIVNEMVHISNAATIQAARAFKQVRLPKPHYIYIPQPQNEKEMNEMAEVLKAVTGLNLEWAKKCLDECKYDLKKALVLFVDLFKIDRIPSSAFDSSSTMTCKNNEDTNAVRSDFQSILNLPHTYGNEEAAASTVGGNQPVKQNKNVIPSNQPVSNPAGPLTRNIHPVNQVQPMAPPIRTMQPMNLPRPMVQPVRNIQPMNLPAPVLAAIRNMPSMNMPSPMVPPNLARFPLRLNLPRPMMGHIHPLIAQRPIMPVNNVMGNNAGNKQKNASRPGLVNIQLKK